MVPAVILLLPTRVKFGLQVFLRQTLSTTNLSQVIRMGKWRRRRMLGFTMWQVGGSLFYENCLQSMYNFGIVLPGGTRRFFWVSIGKSMLHAGLKDHRILCTAAAAAKLP